MCTTNAEQAAETLRLYAHTALQFLAQGAAVHPERIAVRDEYERSSYVELFYNARSIASGLLAHPEWQGCTLVVMDKSVSALAVLFGTLMAGGFYTPIDPLVPQGRIADIAKQLPHALIVTDEANAEMVGGACPDARILLAEELETTATNDEELARVAHSIVGSDPAYVLFTSGSTGTPKGVAVSHASIVGFISSFVATFGITSSDVLANQAPLDFDVSVKDIYGSLAAGAQLVLLPRRLFSAPAQLVEALGDSGATVLIWAVAALCLVSSLHGLEDVELPHIRLVMFSGEVMPMPHLRTWMERLPQATFVNLYGPTEVTCNCLAHVVERDRAYEQGLPLGEALTDRLLMVRTPEGEIARPGQTGELSVGGPWIASGYLGRPDLTQRAFFAQDDLLGLPHTWYRTGDLVRIASNGELFFAGRVDNQIKHMGHRIELEELDAAVERQSGVRRCRCAYDREKQRIWAFIEGEVQVAELRRGLAGELPVAFIPSRMVLVEAMPLTKNGKVDRAALLASHQRTSRMQTPKEGSR